MRSGLTEIQYGIYSECVNDTDSVMYNVSILYELKDDVDADRLISAISEMQRIHPALTVRLSSDDEGNIIQETGDVIPVETIRLSDEEFRIRRKDLERPYDLNGGPLARYEIYITPSARYLFTNVHHSL